MVKQWEGYAEDSMGIIVRYIKGAQLPDYVFDGEQRPSASVPSSKAFKRTKTGKVCIIPSSNFFFISQSCELQYCLSGVTRAS